jgi:osomolarity two-component system response regulator SSK1
MEWGCMQALIDFDGWRKWKDFSQGNGEVSEKSDGKKVLSSANKKKKANRASVGSNPGASSSRLAIHEENETNGTS